MKRSHALIASLALLVSAPSVVLGQTFQEREYEQANAERQRIEGQINSLESDMDRLRNDPDMDEAERAKLIKDMSGRLTQLNQQYDRASTRAGSLAGALDSVAKQAEQAAQSDTEKKKENGWGSKIGDKLLEIGGGLAGELLKRMISGGATNEDRELFSQLVAQRDAAMAEQNAIQDGSNPYGNPIYDANGNIIGWDRDGDGAQDLTDSNGDGEPDSWNGGTNSDAEEFGGLDTAPTPIYRDGELIGYDTNGDGIVDIPVDKKPEVIGNGGSGGASGGSAIGAGLGSGDTGSSGGDDDEGGDDEDEEGDEDEELAAAEDESSTSTGRQGALAQAQLNLQQVRGRMVVIPKPDPMNAGGVYGSQRGGQYGAPANGSPAAGQGNGEEWWNQGNDTWNDGDNGDVPSEWGEFNNEEWNQGGAQQGGAQQQGSGWGQPQQPQGYGSQPQGYGSQPQGYGYGYQPAQNFAQLAEQLSSVDSTIEEWRKVERQRSGFGGDEGYGFREGQSGYGREVDALAPYRTEDGLLDLTRVDIWVIADDPNSGRPSWKEPQPGEMPIMPIRFKVNITPEALETFEAIQGGFVVVKGVVKPMQLPPQIQQQVRGQILELDIHQWLGTTNTPPMNSRPPAHGYGQGGASPSDFDDF
jgi:hypothetical protein